MKPLCEAALIRILCEEKVRYRRCGSVSHK